MMGSEECVVLRVGNILVKRMAVWVKVRIQMESYAMSTWFLLNIGYMVISLQKSRYLYFLLELSVCWFTINFL